jgi:hypothetical protein
VEDPPEGYTWEDIRYVVGGYAWKAVFLDQQGYIITGTTQYNFENGNLDTDAGWVEFQHPDSAVAGEATTDGAVPYTCGGCHTTGYVPDGNQHGLPGLIGTWAEDGVGCEACHGAGSNHVNDPYLARMEVNRDSQACGDCHSRGDSTVLEAVEGFILNYQQYDELFLSKKRVMDCVDCHNPHEGTRLGRKLSIRTECETCHLDSADYQKISDRRHATCIDCHMPYATKSAVGNADIFTADVRTHLMAINPRADSQFDQDGALFEPYLTVDYACKGCHNEDGRAGVLPDEQLVEVATGYHDPDLAGSLNRQRGQQEAEPSADEAAGEEPSGDAASDEETAGEETGGAEEAGSEDTGNSGADDEAAGGGDAATPEPGEEDASSGN